MKENAATTDTDNIRNAPYLHGVRVVGLPLAAGNSVVLKGSELAPRCFWAMGDIYREAGLPAGCVNVLYNQTSHASSVTTALISHPLVRKVNFMGSTQVGSVVASIAGRYIKPITLALGGKASAIVLDDANLGKAAMGCIVGSFMHVGYSVFFFPFNADKDESGWPELHVDRADNRPARGS